MVKRIFRLFLIAFAVTGVTLQFIHSINFLGTLSYYTVLSNLFVLFLFIYILYYYDIKQHEKSDCYSILKGSATVGIFLTFVVYHFILRPILLSTESTYSPYSASDLLVHYIVPIMTILDYIIFDTKGDYKRSFLKYWMIFPIAYILYVYLYVLLGGTFPSFEQESSFPYFFLDYHTYGWSVLLFIIGIAMFYVFLCIALFLTDQYVLKKKTN